MKKLCKPIAIILILMMALTVFTGCGETKQAETALTNLFNALKAGNFDQAKQYMDVKKLSVAPNGTLDPETEPAIKLILNKIDFSIISSELKDDGTVTVKVTLNTPDMKAVLKDFTANSAKQAVVNSITGASDTETNYAEEAWNLFKKSLSNADLPKVSNEIEVTMKHAEDGWKLQVNSRLEDTALGGAISAIQEYINSMK